MQTDVEDGYVMVSHEIDSDNSSGDKPSSSPPPFLAELTDFVESIEDSLWVLNRKIHDHPELGFHEFLAHDWLTSFFEERTIGTDKKSLWKVTRAAYGMRTAWVAVYDTQKPGPVVSYNVEMDALPGIGHACGHNLIATVSVAGGLAAAELAANHGLGGKIVVFGTPAEEDYKVDVSLITHPAIGGSVARMKTSAISSINVAYHGRAAHAAASPWEGINALDALITAYNSLSVLRQQTKPTDIIQGHITNGGAAPNIIHEYAAGSFGIRALNKARLIVLREKVDACFRAGAVATGARLQLDEEGTYADHVPNGPLADAYTRYWNHTVTGHSAPVDDEKPDLDGRNQAFIAWDGDVDGKVGTTLASTDQGDVSYAYPSLSAGFALRSHPVDGSTDRPGGGPHTIDFEKAAGTREAFNRALVAGVALAGTGLDVLAVQGFLDKVKKAFEADMKIMNNAK